MEHRAREDCSGQCRADDPNSGRDVGRPDLFDYKANLQQRREEAFARACAAIESTRFRNLVLDTACWIEAGDWTRNPDDLTRRWENSRLSALPPMS
jgi:hypothetical protein